MCNEKLRKFNLQDKHVHCIVDTHLYKGVLILIGYVYITKIAL